MRPVPRSHSKTVVFRVALNFSSRRFAPLALPVLLSGAMLCVSQQHQAGGVAA